MAAQQQMSLFDIPTYNIDRSVKEALFRAAKSSGMSREEIVDRMNRLAERFGVSLSGGKDSRLSLDVFEKWVNTSDLSRNMPVRAIPIFCKAVNNTDVLNEIVHPLGYQVIGESDRRLLEWAKAYQKARSAKKTMKKLEVYLPEE